VEDLAAVFFRGLLALVHAVARVAIDFLWHAFLETAIRILGWILGAIFHAIARAVRFLLFPIEWLYLTLFDRARRRVTSTPLAHLIAMFVLMFGGFMIGAGASLIYHQPPAMAATASLPEQP
jgi:hypothetical protein